MNIRPVGIQCLFALMLLLLTLPLAQASELKHLDNLEAATLEDFKTPGKWLIVMIWASDCHVCNQEAHAYQDFHFAHGDDDAALLGISMDGESKLDDARDFVSRHGVEFPNLVGEPQDVARFYQDNTGSRWVGTPTFMVYDPRGELAAKQVGAVPVDIIEKFIAQYPQG